MAARALKVARRERNTDVDLSIAVSRNARVYNEEAPAPPFTGVTAGIAVPLKFSNFNKGTVRAARYREQQAEAQYKQALLQVQTEVMQAYRNYQSFAEQVNHYEDGLLRQAREVMDGKIYSYNRGKSLCWKSWTPSVLTMKYKLSILRRCLITAQPWSN